MLVLRTPCPSPCRGDEGPDGGPFDILSVVRPSLFKADAGTAFAALGHPIAQGSALKPQPVLRGAVAEKASFLPAGPYEPLPTVSGAC